MYLKCYMVSSELAAACSSSDLAVVSGRGQWQLQQDVPSGRFGSLTHLFPLPLICLPLHFVGVHVGKG